VTQSEQMTCVTHWWVVPIEISVMMQSLPQIAHLCASIRDSMVKFHVSNVLSKLGVESRTEADGGGMAAPAG